MQVRIIKKVPLDVPGLAVHLLPLSTRVKGRHHVTVVYRLTLGSIGCVGLQLGNGNDKPAVGAHVEQLFAVERNGVTGQPTENILCFALFGGKPPQRTDRRPVTLRGSSDLITLGQKQDARLADGKVDIVTRRNRQGKNAIPNARHVDDRGLRLVLFFLLSLVSLGGVFLIRVLFVSILLVLLVLLLLVFVVALGGHRRGAIFR